MIHPERAIVAVANRVEYMQADRHPEGAFDRYSVRSSPWNPVKVILTLITAPSKPT
jgi:hypothetical protein